MTNKQSELSDSLEIPLHINEVNDDPTVRVLSKLPYVVEEDSNLVLNGLDVFDVDSVELSVVASTENGLLSISRQESDLVLLENCTGNEDVKMSFRASPESTRRVMSTIVYRPKKDFNTEGAAPDIVSLQITDDQGNTVKAYVPIVVLPINDPPRISVPGTNWTYAESDVYDVEAIGNINVLEDERLRIPNIHIKDPDSNAILISVTTPHGSVSFGDSISGVSFRVGTGQLDSHVEMFAPSIEIANDAFSAFSYRTTVTLATTQYVSS